MQVFDPTRGFNAFAQGAQIGGSIRQAQTNAKLAPMVAAGDYKGAAAYAGQRGDLGAAETYRTQYSDQLAQMGEAEKKAAAERAQQLGKLAYGVRNLPYEQRRATLQQQAPMLQQMGIDPQQLMQFDPTDQAIDGVLAQVTPLAELLKQANPEGKVVNDRLVNPYTADVMGDFSDPEGPMSTMGKLAADLNAGRITKEQYDIAAAKMQRGEPSLDIQFGEGGTLSGLSYGSAPKGKDAAIVRGRDGNPLVSPGPQQAQYSKAVQNVQEFEAQSGIVMDEIDRAISQVNNFSAGPGTVLKEIPIIGGQTPAGQLENLLKTIQANVGFDKLQAMRDTSPTGGALGQVTEKELAFLQAVFGSLEQDQTPENLKYNLSRLREHMAGRGERLRAALAADYPTLAETSQFRSGVADQVSGLTGSKTPAQPTRDELISKYLD